MWIKMLSMDLKLPLDSVLWTSWEQIMHKLGSQVLSSAKKKMINAYGNLCTVDANSLGI